MHTLSGTRRGYSSIRTRITPDEAAAIVLDSIEPLPPVVTQLRDSLGLVAAETVTSPINIPPWDNSAMDGYAVRSGDLGAPGTELEVIETTPAGDFPTREVGPGQCVRVFTGAPVPRGADSVVRQEDVARVGGKRVTINRLRDLGRNIRRAGEDLERGATALESGTVIGPAEMGLLASVTAAELRCHPRPRVAILATGDEVVDLDRAEEVLAGRKIASSNTYSLLGAITAMGGIPDTAGISGDDPEELKHCLERACEADLVITTGGVSVGDHDYVRTVLDDMGAEIKFWRITMRPGAPVGFGLAGGTPWIGLPGNPVSALVTAGLFVEPAIRKLAGHTAWFRDTISVTVDSEIELGPPLTHFLRVKLHHENRQRPRATLTGPQGSGILSSMSRAEGLLIVPAGKKKVQHGDVLDAIPFRLDRFVTEPPWQ